MRLKANRKWRQIPYTRGKLTSQTKILDMIVNAIPLSKEDQDSMTTTYNLDPNFVVDIPTTKDYKEVEPINHSINCHTEDYKLDDIRTGAGVLINNSHNDIAEEAIHLGNNATVFSRRAASHLIIARDNTKIKSKTTIDAVLVPNKLVKNNQVLIRWIPGHSGYAGNEKEGTLAKKGANNIVATLLKLPISKVTWDVAIRED